MTPAGAIVALALGATPPEPAAPPTPPPAPATAPAAATPPPANAAKPGDGLEPDSTPITGDSAPTEPLADEATGSTVHSAYIAAEQHQGPLDGHWRLSDGDGAPLFDFQLSDPGAAPSAKAGNPKHPEIEGAWRDLRHEGGGWSGFLLSVRHDGARLQIDFDESDPSQPVQLILRPTADGGWTGELTEAGAPRIVFLDRQKTPG